MPFIRRNNSLFPLNNPFLPGNNPFFPLNNPYLPCFEPFFPRKLSQIPRSTACVPLGGPMEKYKRTWGGGPY